MSRCQCCNRREYLGLLILKDCFCVLECRGFKRQFCGLVKSVIILIDGGKPNFNLTVSDKITGSKKKKKSFEGNKKIKGRDRERETRRGEGACECEDSKMASYNMGLIGGLVCLCISTVMSIVACIIFGWAEYDGFPEVTYSLWRVCVEAASTEVCDEIDDPSGALDATRRMLITAIVNTGIASVFAMVHAKKTSMTGAYPSRSMVNGTLISGIIAVVLKVACSATYGANVEDDYGTQFDLGPAYYLLNVSLFFCLCGTIAVVSTYKRTPITPGSGGRVLATATVINYPTTHQQQHPQYGLQPYPYGIQPPPPYPGVYPTHGQTPYVAGNPPAYPAPAYPAPTYPAPAYAGPNNPAYPPPGPVMKY